MTHSIAWSKLCIATRNDDDQALLVRRFQLIADDLEDKVYEGAIGLRLSNNFTYKTYQSMKLERVLQYAARKEAVVIINTDEDLKAMTPYMKETVTAFGDKLDD
jgi:hypothetical protein